ncbi:hypothetical protein PoB_001304600 [Plakobranchus ocellatus]|uniref:Uncharacterized protein n=1 Tax=Plakobranchus ocellatus TaxID=259542 RepID=A0AAV3YGV8_9GAST|nr:hypothetical protein PoB_001304600 [Plakobranchus ocellatus]
MSGSSDVEISEWFTISFNFWTSILKGLTRLEASFCRRFKTYYQHPALANDLEIIYLWTSHIQSIYRQLYRPIRIGTDYRMCDSLYAGCTSKLLEVALHFIAEDEKSQTAQLYSIKLSSAGVYGIWGRDERAALKLCAKPSVRLESRNFVQAVKRKEETNVEMSLAQFLAR